MRYLIGLPLQDDESREFNRLIEKYKMFAPRLKISLKPHITLIRPAEAKVSPHKAKQIFEKIHIQQSNFTVMFRGFDAFFGRNCAVYAKPTVINEFVKLHSIYQPLAEQILSQSDEFGFHPHLTLINRLKEDDAKELLNVLNKLNFKQSFTFDRVVLYQRDGNEPFWVELASQKLLIFN